MERFSVTGMSCAACSSRIEKVVSALPGVESAAVNLLTNSMNVAYAAPATAETICRAVEKAGYGASPQRGPKRLRNPPSAKTTASGKRCGGGSL